MKTVLEWLETLPHEYKDKAIVYAEHCHTLKKLSVIKEESLEESLLGAFDWNKSPEGFQYWENVYESLNIN